MTQYEYSRTEQMFVIATTVSQQILFEQDVFHITIYNTSNFYCYVHEEGGTPAVTGIDAPLFPMSQTIGQTLVACWQPYIIERLIPKLQGISVITLEDNCNLRIIARF